MSFVKVGNTAKRNSGQQLQASVQELDVVGKYFENFKGLEILKDYENIEFELVSGVITEMRLQQMVAEDCAHKLTVDDYFTSIMGEDFNDPDMIDILIYTYKWHLSEENLCRMILRQFMIQFPWRMTRSERELFSVVILSKREINLLSFLLKIIKLYVKDFKGDSEVHRVFTETLYLCYKFQQRVLKKIGQAGQKAWLNVTIMNAIKEVDDLLQGPRDDDGVDFLTKEPVRVEIMASYESVTSPFFACLRTSPGLFMEQLCLFDYSCMARIKLGEFVHKRWSGPDRKTVAPALCYLAEAPTRLSRFITFALLTLNDKKTSEMTARRLLEVVELLIDKNNFQSSYAIYMGITSFHLEGRYALENILDKNELKRLGKIKTLFSSDNNYDNIKKQQMQYMTEPCIPQFAVLLKDIFSLEEFYKMSAEGGEMINLMKMKKTYTFLKFIAHCRQTPYQFKQLDFVIDVLSQIPSISEELLEHVSSNLEQK